MSNPNNCSARVVPHSYYRTPAGHTVSIFSSWRPEGSTIERRGFTIEWPDGTRGVLPMGRKIFENEAEAQACIDANPRFPGFNQY